MKVPFLKFPDFLLVQQYEFYVFVMPYKIEINYGKLIALVTLGDPTCFRPLSD